MVGRLLLAPWLSVNLAPLQSSCQSRTEQEVVNANTAVLLERLTEVIPEGELSGFAGVQVTECIGVAQREHRPITLARFGLE